MNRVLMQAMQKAIARNDIEAIKRCCRAGAIVELQAVTNEVIRGNVQPDTLKYLFRLGLVPTTELVSLAVRGDKADLLKVILDAVRSPKDALDTLDPSMTTGNCTVPYLSSAAQFKQEQVVNVLLEYGASPTLLDSLGEPPLHYALLGNSMPVIEAIEAAIRKERAQSIANRAAAAADTHDLEDELTKAVYDRRVDDIIRILRMRPAISESAMASLWTLVVGCARPSVLRIAKLLLEGGISPVVRGDQYPSGISQAVTSLDVEMFDKFLKCNPDSLYLESADFGHRNEPQLVAQPLGYALTQKGYYADKFIQYALKEGAYVDDVNALNETIEDVVERCGSDMAKRIVDKFGRTGTVPAFTVEFAPDYAAARAVETADIPALRNMHESGAVDLSNVFIQRRESAPLESLLEFLVTTRLPLEWMREVATFLTEEVGLVLEDVMVPFTHHDHAVHYLLELGDEGLIRIMLGAMEPDVRTRAMSEGNLLTLALKLDEPAVVRALLDLGADPLQKVGSNTPLEALQEHYNNVKNYAELWSLLEKATFAAEVKQAEYADAPKQPA